MYSYLKFMYVACRAPISFHTTVAGTLRLFHSDSCRVLKIVCLALEQAL